MIPLKSKVVSVGEGRDAWPSLSGEAYASSMAENKKNYSGNSVGVQKSKNRCSYEKARVGPLVDWRTKKEGKRGVDGGGGTEVWREVVVVVGHDRGLSSLCFVLAGWATRLFTITA